jgi:hypothetical protein
VPQWHWLRGARREDIAWRNDAAARGNESDSVAIDPADFIIREVEDPLCEIALLCFVRRNFGKKNWTVFQADYAIPALFALLGENTPLDKVKEWLALVREVTNNSRGALPPCRRGWKTLDVGDRDGSQFDCTIQARTRISCSPARAAHLTMLAQSTGMNDSQGNVQDSIFDASRRPRRPTFRRSAGAVRQAHPGCRVPLAAAGAYFELAAEDREDVNGLADRAVKFSTPALMPTRQSIRSARAWSCGKRRVIPPLSRSPQSRLRASAPLANRATPAAKGRDVLFRTARCLGWGSHGTRPGSHHGPNRRPDRDRRRGRLSPPRGPCRGRSPPTAKAGAHRVARRCEALAEAVGTALASAWPRPHSSTQGGKMKRALLNPF